MYQGNWQCSSCGGAITELPFEPRSTLGLTCRPCYGKQRGAAAPTDTPDETSTSYGANDADLAALENPATPASEKTKHEGNWTCATCGGSITSLPFTPRSTSNLKCLDCFKASRA